MARQSRAKSQLEAQRRWEQSQSERAKKAERIKDHCAKAAKKGKAKPRSGG